MQQATEFDERMLQAMARQEHQCQTLSADVRQQREVLLALQQRAMALETLAERHARAQRARAAKLEQKRTDEFATQRAARRAAHNEHDHSSNQP
jgi:flagellar export protein FliJ